MEKVVSWFKSEFQPWFSNLFASEVTKIANAQSELATVKAELATANTERVTLAGRITSLEVQLTERETTIGAKDAEIKTLSESLDTEKSRTMNALASQNLRPDDLPKGSTESGGAKSTQQQVEALNKRISESSDPREKYTLNQQIKQLRATSKN